MSNNTSRRPRCLFVLVLIAMNLPVRSSWAWTDTTVVAKRATLTQNAGRFRDALYANMELQIVRLPNIPMNQQQIDWDNVQVHMGLWSGGGPNGINRLRLLWNLASINATPPNHGVKDVALWDEGVPLLTDGHGQQLGVTQAALWQLLLTQNGLPPAVQDVLGQIRLLRMLRPQVQQQALQGLPQIQQQQLTQLLQGLGPLLAENSLAEYDVMEDEGWYERGRARGQAFPFQGQQRNGYHPVTPGDADEVWGQYSARYAETALQFWMLTGRPVKFYCFIAGARRTRIFYTYEYPVLRALEELGAATVYFPRSNGAGVADWTQPATWDAGTSNRLPP
jgi:hypothetical protein